MSRKSSSPRSSHQEDALEPPQNLVDVVHHIHNLSKQLPDKVPLGTREDWLYKVITSLFREFELSIAEAVVALDDFEEEDSNDEHSEDAGAEDGLFAEDDDCVYANDEQDDSI